MNIQEWWNLFVQQIIDAEALQWIAVALGVAEVLLAKSNKIWLYPTGIVSTLISTYILYHSRLYSESILNAYYVIMSVYGWWHWVKKKHLPPVKITASNKKDWLTVAGIVIGAFLIFVVVLRNSNPLHILVWDAWVSATAWAGMWLLAKRKLENWILLNISNIFAIPLLIYKQLPLFAMLTLFLFIVAVFGYFEWKKKMKGYE